MIYAGTGETEIRLDVSYGDGVYKSTDAGRHLEPSGPPRVEVRRPHPHPSARPGSRLCRGTRRRLRCQRGTRGVPIARWRQELEQCSFRDANTGAVDLAMDPRNPRILFAAFWQTRRNFWNISSGGPGSGLFRSTDGGESWTEISRYPGLPTVLGKLGVTVSPALSGRVWALVETEAEKAGLYRSEDYGESWELISSHRDLMHRPWYYTHVFADPCHAETVYVTNLHFGNRPTAARASRKSRRRTATTTTSGSIRADPNRMIEGNDGGACVSFNGGQTWSSIYNQPTAQFYRIDTDNQYPYRVYGTQQDNTTIVPSASAWGGITLGDCYLSRHRGSGFIAVHPRDSEHRLFRRDRQSPAAPARCSATTIAPGQIQLVNVWPEDRHGIAPKDLQVPLRLDVPDRLLAARHRDALCRRQPVFRSRDEGMSWEESRPISASTIFAAGPSGGAITRESAGAEVHATCASLVRNRRIGRARSGPRPMTGWFMSRATTARAGRTSRRRACRSSPMSAASRSRRTMPIRSM